MTKSDNAAEIGLHVFERAGLGKAPFKFVGAHEEFYQAHPGAPRQCGGSCDYCGTGIVTFCIIRSVDGRQFKVGTDCLRKTGDAGLIKAFTSSPAQRHKAAAQRKARDERVIAEWAALWADPATTEAFAGVTFESWRWGHEWGKKTHYTQTAEEHWQGLWKLCGAAGRARTLKNVKRLLSPRG